MDSNIIGKPHLEYVQDQIKLRQEILGKKKKDSADIVWMNGRTSWVRLASSVNIEDQPIASYNVSSSQWETISNGGAQFRSSLLEIPEYSGNELASQMVLQGGVLNQDGTQKFGVSNTNSILPSSTSNYGFSEFGAQAMPGIISFTSETNNKGSLRFANLQIRANNTKQFEYIEALYLRLGYSMLLEWGNSSYPSINPETSATSYETNRYSLTAEFLDNPPQNAEGTKYFYTKIEENRKSSHGNYDGFLGRVTNFSWEFTKEGYYLISLKLISQGSVVESLKVNVVQNSTLFANSKNSKGALKENQQENTLLTQISQIVNPLRNGFKHSPSFFSPFAGFFTPGGVPANLLLSYVFQATDETSYNFQSTKSEYSVLKSLKDAGNTSVTDDELNNASKTVDACAATFGSTHFVKYIRFGSLLGLLNQYYLLYGSDEENEPILFKLDNSTDQYCFSNRKSISSDPSKLIVRYKGDYLGTKIEIFNDAPNNINPFHQTVDGVDVGKIMNLYFSYELLENVIKSNLDSTTGSLDLYRFLKSLLNEANILLGGVNKLNLRLVDKNFGTYENPEIIQVVEFYDEVCPFEVKKLRNAKEEEPSLVIYGFGNEVSGSRDGSFVTDYQFKTEITNKLGNMIAVGAQANGQAVGEDATLFSKWNYGLVDRILPEKFDIDQKIKQADQVTVGYLNIISAYRDYYNSFTGAQSSTLTLEDSNVLFGTTFTDFVENATGYSFPNCNITPVDGELTSLTGFTETQKAFFQKFYALEAISKKTSTPFIGFVPVGFNLTLDGMSGVRIFDRLKIDSRFLPSNYGDTLDFIITKLDHKIVNNKWETSIGTMSVPKLFDKLDLNLEDILNTLPPVTTGFEDLVGFYSYDYSALVHMLKQTVKITAVENSTAENTSTIDRLNRLNAATSGSKVSVGEVLTTNGNLNLPGASEFYGERYQKSPLVSIGSVKNLKNNQRGTFGLLTNSFFGDGSGNHSFRKFTTGLTLLSQDSNKTYYNGEYYLAQPAAEALYEFGKFIEENWDGEPFMITSAYRSYNHQNGLKTSDSSAKTASAGSSPHGWGGAIDIQELIAKTGAGKLTSNPTINQTFRTTSKAYAFWAEHAPKFGWYNPLRLRDGKGVDESWHWEFWGKPGQTLKVDAPRKDSNIFQDGTKITVPSNHNALAIGRLDITTDPETGKIVAVKED
jgi:LAS superfamily LD-carboxypeptidase LdcB